jgi:capsular exopolysaccharide synthesis family protein
VEAAKLLAILRRWWWLLLLGIIVGGGASFAVSQAMTPIYRASTTLLINQTQTPGVIAYNDVLTSERLTKTYRELVTKRPVLQEVVDRVGEPKDIETLRNMVSVSVIRDTQLLRLSVESSDPIQAAILANSTAQAFIGQNDITDLSTAGSVTVVERAVVPTTPVKPRVALNLMVGVLAGLVVAAGLGLLMEYLDDTVKSGQDVERVAGLTTLGVVMRFGRRASRQPVSGYGSRSPAAEAYRAIRTSVQFATMDRLGQVLLVTSPNAGDGKSTTAANLAVTMASAGKRVVLVDGDLRKPSLHQIFNLDNSVGLTSALLSGNGARSCVEPSGFDNLSVLTSGPLPPNPSELLSSSRMRDLVDAMRREADAVIVDSPPALVVTDATLLAALADGTILVAEAGRTRSAALRQAVDGLSRATDRLLGVVLNKISRRGAPAYHHYYHYHADETARKPKSSRARAPRSTQEPVGAEERVA